MREFEKLKTTSATNLERASAKGLTDEKGGKEIIHLSPRVFVRSNLLLSGTGPRCSLFTRPTPPFCLILAEYLNLIILYCYSHYWVYTCSPLYPHLTRKKGTPS